MANLFKLRLQGNMLSKVCQDAHKLPIEPIKRTPKHRKTVAVGPSSTACTRSLSPTPRLPEP
eukprot:3480690-Amphidinium_carterae.1